MSGHQRVRILAIALSALLLPATTLAAPASAITVTPPSVRLIAAADGAVIHLYRNGRYEVRLPLFVAAEGGSFELWLQRATYDDPVTSPVPCR